MIRAEEILENQMIDLIDEVYANSGLGRWFGKGGVGVVLVAGGIDMTVQVKKQVNVVMLRKVVVIVRV